MSRLEFESKFESQSLLWRQFWQFVAVMKSFYRNACGFDDLDGNCYLW